MTSQERPHVAVLVPRYWRARMFDAAAEARLAEVATLRSNAGDEIHEGEMPALVDGAVACITGWGTPAITEALLARNPQLHLIAHTAGSVRDLVPATAIERGLIVSHANPIMADAVAEFTILQMLLVLRGLHVLDADMKAGVDWEEAKLAYRGRHLGASVVGLVGAGAIGRAVIRRLTAFGTRVVVFDPFMSTRSASALGVELVGLDDIFRTSDVVSVHAAALPATRHLVGARQLALLRDGGVLVNTARAWIVDEAALVAELRSGRLVAALDVFDEEPLPLDHPLRRMPNVVLSPHRAGETTDTLFQQGRAMVDEVARYLSGEPLHYQIPIAALDSMA